MKRLFLLMLLILPFVGSVAAQSQLPKELKGQSFVFEFVEGKDMFFVPYGGNYVTLARFVQLIEDNRELLSERKMYISVASYATGGNEEQTAREVAHIQRNRVKSELITKGGVTEDAFATDRYIAEPYEGLKNVVVVTIPASLETIERLLGASAAESVRAYYQGLEDARIAKEKAAQAEKDRLLAEQRAKEDAEKARLAEQERLAKEKAEQERLAAEQRAKAEEAARLKAEEEAIKPLPLTLRTNLLRLATLTADLGVEYKINKNWGILLHGTYTDWKWDGENRNYAMWQISPEVRYYFGANQNWYGGVAYQTGEFDYKLGDSGYQSTDLYHTAGITAGYMLKLSDCLSLDLGIGAGYTRASYDQYTIQNNIRVRTAVGTKNYFGLNQASVTLRWNIFK